MNQGAKVLLGVLAFGGVAALVFASGEKKANASPGTAPPILPPLTPPAGGIVPGLPPQGGIVVVPPIADAPTGPQGQEPGPTAPAPIVIPAQPTPVTPPFVPPTQQLPTLPTLPPAGTTISLPGIGTFNPATGNVFGPNGVIVGTFNPNTGVFTTTTGQTIQVPGFGPSPLPPMTLPTPFPTQPAPAQPVLTLPTLPVVVPPPSANPAEQATNPPAPDTMQVVTTMLDQEHLPHWRIAAPGLGDWQRARGLSPDGNFGPGTAMVMAKEIGTVPIIRAWPKGSFLGSQDLPNYQAKLRALAASVAEPQRSQLLAAAQREQGQGFGTPEKPIVNTITLHGV
jgi:hypothetical protein